MIEKLNLGARTVEDKLDIPEVPQEVVIKEEERKDKKGLWARIFNKNKLKKPQTIVVFFLRNNGTMEPLYKEPKNGMFDIAGKSYHERRDCKYIYVSKGERYPLAIIPEWSLVPLGTKGYYDMTLEEKMGELQDHVVKGIRHAEIVRIEGQDKKKINPKLVIGIIIALIVGYALLRNYIK